MIIYRTQVYTVKQAAEFLKVTPRTIAGICNRGGLTARKLGKEWRIPGWALIAYSHNPELKEEMK